MEQTILVMEVIQEVWEAEKGEPDCMVEQLFKRNLLFETFLGEYFHSIE